MDFRDYRQREEPEINLIPMIDLFLVIIIFLMLTTTYSRFSELQLTLPEAAADSSQQRNNEIQAAVDAAGKYVIGQQRVAAPSLPALVDALRAAAANKKEPVVVINADAQASHQSVVNLMEAARQAGLVQITFATQAPGK